MDNCDLRTRAYKNGKTFDECKKLAEIANLKIQQVVKQNGKVSWFEILNQVDHDELVYKLTLKYLRRDGFNIGNWQVPQVRI